MERLVRREFVATPRSFCVFCLHARSERKEVVCLTQSFRAIPDQTTNQHHPRLPINRSAIQIRPSSVIAIPVTHKMRPIILVLALLPTLALSSFHPALLPRQQLTCSVSEKPCGDGCVPLGYTCCPDGSGGCPVTEVCWLGSN